MLMIATIKLPKEIEPNEYVSARLAAPRVAPFGMPPGFPAQKYQDP